MDNAIPGNDSVDQVLWPYRDAFYVLKHRHDEMMVNKYSYPSLERDPDFNTLIVKKNDIWFFSGLDRFNFDPATNQLMVSLTDIIASKINFVLYRLDAVTGQSQGPYYGKPGFWALALDFRDGEFAVATIEVGTPQRAQSINKFLSSRIKPALHKGAFLSFLGIKPKSSTKTNQTLRLGRPMVIYYFDHNTQLKWEHSYSEEDSLLMFPVTMKIFNNSAVIDSNVVFLNIRTGETDEETRTFFLDRETGERRGGIVKLFSPIKGEDDDSALATLFLDNGRPVFIIRYQFDTALTGPIPITVAVLAKGSDISGSVVYDLSNAVVKDVAMDITGENDGRIVNGSDGRYALKDLFNGLDYSLKPKKIGNLSTKNIITLNDASLVLDYLLGRRTLSPQQIRAADVIPNGRVAFDVFISIWRHAKGYPPIYKNDKTGEWVFTPPSRAFSFLSSDQPNQDFRATLLGDVDGSWSSTSLFKKSIRR